MTSEEHHTNIAQVILFAPKGLIGFQDWNAAVNWLRLTHWFLFRWLAWQVRRG